ncbi:methyltransferase [Mycobacterium sp. 1165196.3]|nr:class I SAM-dependent methyltransferase [Mycobacterium sp. 1165196.3]OBK32893.1 methyltransferase [Mycobacterium sp. 1165196.3]
MGVIDRWAVTRADDRPADRTTVHRLWKAIVLSVALIVAIACFLQPLFLLGMGGLLLLLVIARLVYPAKDQYIPHLYARDIRIYDESYRSFINRTLSDLRRRRIPGHTVLWEAAQLPEPCVENSDELVLDLGVWLGWSTRLISDTCNRKVYGFDTFSGLVEDWQVEGQVVKRGTFAVSDPFGQRFMRDTGVSFTHGVPDALGRKVEFIKGSTYDTLAPFLAGRPAAPIRLFHMDLDTYESCVHALEICKDHFVVGSILVFDEYLITNGEMRAFYEFQRRYDLEWNYRAWGLETMEMNIGMTISRWKRMLYYLVAIPAYWLIGEGSHVWKFFRAPFWRFWLGAHVGDMLFMLGAVGSRKSVSLEITGLGKLEPGWVG